MGEREREEGGGGGGSGGGRKADLSGVHTRRIRYRRLYHPRRSMSNAKT